MMMMLLVVMMMAVVVMMVVLVVVTMITNTIYWQLGLSWPQQFLTCRRKKVMRPNNWQQTLGNDVDGEMKNIKILENIKKDIEKT